MLTPGGGIARWYRSISTTEEFDVKRHLIALLGALAVLLALGSGVAQAQSVQGVEQLAGTGQSASSNASSTQTNPSNSNISVRIFSPGDNGSVSQSNNSAAVSGAINKASTQQAVTQAGAGAGEQALGQIGLTGQKAKSKATSEQVKPSNSNISVRIHSEGDDGNVEQSNNSLAGSLAANKAETNQTADQRQDGCGCPTGKKKDHGSGGAGVQAVGQKALTLQDAKSEATSKQYSPSNSNIGVRIHSPGKNGSVDQSNNSKALSFAGNLAATNQAVTQSQSDGCGCSGDRVQAVGQFALTGQHADSDAKSIQKGAKNSNTPVRIHSYGDDGNVEQSNKSGALSGAINAAETTQTVDQSQGGCGCPVPMKDHGGSDKRDGYDGHGGLGGALVQAVGQIALTGQKADSDATSEQWWASNSNAPVREKSYGGGGSVNQSNNSFAASLALNLARTNQWVRQNQ
jgi:hypothetical protein